MMALFSPARVRFKPIGHVKMLLSGTTSITFFKTSQDNKGVRFLGTGEAFTWQPTDNHNSVLLHPLRSTIKQASLTPRDEATTFSLVYDVQTGFRGHTMRSRTNEIKRGLNSFLQWDAFFRLEDGSLYEKLERFGVFTFRCTRAARSDGYQHIVSTNIPWLFAEKRIASIEIRPSGPHWWMQFC
jgi:hypothetical protein